MNKLGMDLSKAYFDVMLRTISLERIHARFENSQKGLAKLEKWLQAHDVKQVHVCMEATNIYWEGPAEYLYAKGHTVSVVNPRRIKGFAISQLQRNKTDKVDSGVILDYCIAMSPKAWTPPTAEQRQLRNLKRRRDDLIKTRTQEKNRLAGSQDEYIRESIQTLIAFLNQQIQEVEAKIKALIQQNEPMQEQKRLLTSIKGIGDVVATTLLAEMYDLADYEDAHAAAADAGLTPSHYESGDTIRRKPHLSKIGKASVRGVLFLPAINAIKNNPIVKALADRLEEKGKPRMVIICAAMRKLIHLAYGVLKNKTPFDPDWTPFPHSKPVTA